MSSGNTESTNLLSPELNILLGELLSVERLQVLDRRLVVRQLIGRVLRVLREFELSVSRDGSLDWLKGTSDEVEQGGFTGTVVSDNGNSDVSSSCLSESRIYRESMSTPSSRPWYK